MQLSIWERESFFASRDIIIIGAGLTGLWSALALKEKAPSLTILIVDKGLIPAGASTRNAGFACFGSPTELIHDAKLMGPEQMLQTAAKRLKGIEKIRKTFGDTAIDFTANGGYECIREGLHNMEQLADDLLWLNKLLKDVTHEQATFNWANDKLDVFGLKGFTGLLHTSLEGGLHSGKLVQALTKKVQAAGVDILQNMGVEAVETAGSSISLHTNQSVTLECQKLLICTNAFLGHLYPQYHVVPARGQVLVTEPVPGLKLKGNFHFDEGFYYFRNLGNRILLGGARNQSLQEEQTHETGTTPVIQQALERFLNDHLLGGMPVNIDCRWSGIMGFTASKTPLVVHPATNITSITACNGMGVALAPILAEEAISLL